MAALQPDSFIIGILAFESISLNPLKSINVQLHVIYHIQEGRDSTSCFADSNLLLLMNAAIFILPIMIFQGTAGMKYHICFCLYFVPPKFWKKLQHMKKKTRFLLQIKRQKEEY